jgi:hypothetical protein
MNLDTRQLSFMAIITALLLLFVQGATIYMLVAKIITAQEYLAAWVPLLTLSLGYWFGQAKAGSST